MEKVCRFDRSEVSGDAVLTEEGYIRATAIVTRTGIFLYNNPDGTLRRELRHPSDVWDEESISSMSLIPVTNNHPDNKLVNSKNFKELAIGFTGETIKKDGDFILATLVITDHDGVDYVKNQGRKQLSLGYTVDLHPDDGVYKGERYDYRQKNIRYNHLAIVEKARAGADARIALDSMDTVEILLKKEDQMAKRKIKIDEDEMMVEPEIGDYIDRLQMDVKNLQDERNRVEMELSRMREELEKAFAERDSMQAKMDDPALKVPMGTVSMDSMAFQSAVKERVRVITTAEQTLDKSKRQNLDSMSTSDIKKAVITQCRKTICLDGKSVAYVDAMFDTILDDRLKSAVNVDNVEFLTENKNLDSQSTTMSARDKMISTQKDMHKNKG